MMLPALGIILLVQCARLLPGEYFAECARAAARDGHYLKSIAFAHRGIEWDENNPDLHLYLGMARVGQGEQMTEPRARASFYTDAIKAFEKACSLVPQENLYVLQLAAALDGVDRFEEAEWAYYKALQLDPKSASLQRYYEWHLKLWAGTAPGSAPAEAQAP
jgi:tetratricopeptide (TPR) repeat protein